MSLGATQRTVNTQGMMRSAHKSRQILARCLFEFPQLSVDLAGYPPFTGLYFYALPPSLLRVHIMPTSFHAVSLGSGIQDTSLKWRWTKCNRTAKGDKILGKFGKVKELLKRKRHSRRQSCYNLRFPSTAHVQEEQEGAVKQTRMVREVAVLEDFLLLEVGQLCQGQEMTHC